MLDSVEDRLERERDQLPLWLPVALGGGIAAWFLLPVREYWIGFMLGAAALAALGLVLGRGRRIGRALVLGGLAMALGCALIWWRAELLQHDVLAKPMMTPVEGTVEKVEDRVAEEKIRLTIATRTADLPARVRVTIKGKALDPAISKGAELRLRARLAPPPVAALPGGYDFSRTAWFQGLGAVGQAMGDIEVLKPGAEGGGLRQRLSTHVRAQIGGSAGGIAAAFASGDRGGIDPADEEAMRASGLTHLLSISGLHVTAVVAAAMFLCLRLLALSSRLALNWPLMTISAGAGAACGIGYTLLTGAEVPTIRSCIAALLVLLGLAIGREALTLRLVATGAIIVLLLWPESLVGPSFQLSFAAITAIVALHEQPQVKSWFARREEGWLRRLGRAVGALLLTGLVVEFALAPIALFHFHKSGLYGALANMAAIPLTTFVIMPLEALALSLDLVGAGAPFWWLTEQALGLLLGLARIVAAWPGAVAMTPGFSTLAFALIIGGTLWMLLWTSAIRLLGLLPFVIGTAIALAEPAPDVLITDDGRHMAVRGPDGRMALLRERTGEFMRDVIAEQSGEEEVELTFDDLPNADCSLDLCTVYLRTGGRDWLVGATRSSHLVRWSELVSLCGKLDIILSERRLPPACTPKWLKVDRLVLRRTGGLALILSGAPIVKTTRGGRTDHPWAAQPLVGATDGGIGVAQPKFAQ